MNYSGYSINLMNHQSNLRLSGKCILDNNDSLWIIKTDCSLLWVQRSPHLEISIDEYSEDDYSMQLSKEWTDFLDLLSK